MVEFHVIINGPDIFFSRNAFFPIKMQYIVKYHIYSDTKDMNGNLYSVK